MTHVYRCRDPRFPMSPPAAHSLAAVFVALGVLVCLAACDSAIDGSAGSAVPRPSAAEEGQASGGAQPRLGADGQIIRTTVLRIGGVAVTAEIADTDALRQRGLMFRDTLPDDYGMLFVYGDERVRSFWMMNTPISLDIAFMDRNGFIINIERMEPQSEENYYSQGPMMYALEMREGWFADNGVGPGDRMEF